MFCTPLYGEYTGSMPVVWAFLNVLYKFIVQRPSPHVCFVLVPLVSEVSELYRNLRETGAVPVGLSASPSVCLSVCVSVCRADGLISASGPQATAGESKPAIQYAWGNIHPCLIQFWVWSPVLDPLKGVLSYFKPKREYKGFFICCHQIQTGF